MAVTMLGIVMLGLMSTVGRMIRTVADDRSRILASAAADERLALVRQWPTYASLDSAYAGVEANTPRPGWTRTTSMTRIGGITQINDYKRITVQVAAPLLSTPVSRSITVAAP